MLHQKAFDQEEMQLCLRLASDTAFTRWLEHQAEGYLEIFGATSPEQLGLLQAEYNAVRRLQKRVVDGVKSAELARSSLAAQAGHPRHF